MELTEENLLMAYKKALSIAGIGAAENHWDGLAGKKIYTVVPAEMIDEFPSRLLASMVRVCTSEEYGWGVESEEPEIDPNVTFIDLLEDWAMEVVED